MTSPFLSCPQQILNEPSNKTSLSETMKIGISKQFSSPFFFNLFPKDLSFFKTTLIANQFKLVQFGAKKSLHKSLRPLMYLYNLNWLKLWTAWNCTCCRYRAPNLQFLPSLYFSAKANSQKSGFIPFLREHGSISFKFVFMRNVQTIHDVTL